MAGEIKKRLEMEAAKAELLNLENAANLPPTWASGIVRLSGFLLIVLGVVSVLEKDHDSTFELIASLVGVGLVGGAVVAWGSFIQYVFDIRTLVLRKSMSQAKLETSRTEQPNA